MLRHRHIVELYAQPVRSEQHAGQKKHKQGRYAETITGLTDQYAAKNKKGGHKNPHLYGNIHSQEFLLLPAKLKKKEKQEKTSS